MVSLRRFHILMIHMNLNLKDTTDTFPQPFVSSTAAGVRLLTGLLQGLALYFLYSARTDKTWPSTEPLIFSGLALVMLFVPVLFISSFGQLQKSTLLKWMLIAVLIAFGLGFHDNWRHVGVAIQAYGRDRELVRLPSMLLWFYSCVGFYIAHSLVLAAGIDGKRIASYSTYFETAWKLLVQIKFSVLFACALWSVLWLGAGLFDLIQLPFLKDLLQKSWFAIPVTVFAFACAMHLTDVRPAIVRGIRNLLLVLLSWILPLTVLIVGGFLLSLPFTGLSPLWATKHATALLLAACAVLIVLINTAFQNGLLENEIARILRVTAKLASFLLTPLIVIATYALLLRVSQYGWTTDRIIAACCLLVGSVYAIGYTWAACQRQGGWLGKIAPINIGAAMIVLAVLLALFSPLLDPARISVNHQMARLESDRSLAEKFDYDYLKQEGKRYGLSALENLKTTKDGLNAAVIKEKSEQALLKQDYWGEKAVIAVKTGDLQRNLKIWPIGKTIPASFLTQDWKAFAEAKKLDTFINLPDCLRYQSSFCELFLIDFDGDGKPEILVNNISQKHHSLLIFKEQQNSSWLPVSQLDRKLVNCPRFLDKLKTGDFSLEQPSNKSLIIDGRKFTHQEIDSRVYSPFCGE